MSPPSTQAQTAAAVVVFADAHLAEHDQVGALVGGSIHGGSACIDAGSGTIAGQRWLDADVTRGVADPDVDRREPCAQRPGHRRGGRDPGLERGEHRLRDLWRIGADAGARHAVVRDEDERPRVLDRRPRRPLPSREPHRELVEAGQRTGRPEHGIGAGAHRRAGLGVGLRQIDEQVAERGHANISV